MNLDPDVVRGIRIANEASIALITLMVNDDTRDEAMKLVVTDPAYADPVTCTAIASLAVSAIKSLADELGLDPLELVQVAGISAAAYNVQLERKLEGE